MGVLIGASSPLTPEERLYYEQLRAVKKLQAHENKLQKKYYELNVKQRSALSVVGARAWLLQGPSLIQENRLIPDLFIKVSSVLLGLPVNDTLAVFHAVHRKLADDMKPKDFIFFRTSKKTKEKELEIQKRREKKEMINDSLQTLEYPVKDSVKFSNVKR